MSRFVFAILVAITGGNRCDAFSTGFEDLPPSTSPATHYAPGSSFSSGGIQFTAVRYPENFTVSVHTRNYAKGGGNELFMGSGVGVSIAVPPMASQVTFKFGQYNPWNGLTINGQASQRPLNIKGMNGTSLGGVSIAVVGSSSVNHGTVTLIGPIETLTIGGYELAVDDLAITAPVTTPSIADFNQDGMVDGSDFLQWQRNLGRNDASPAHGDADNDHDVDRNDLAFWRYHFGRSSAGGGDSAPIPEPASIIMLSAASLAMWTIRRAR